MGNHNGGLIKNLAKPKINEFAGFSLTFAAQEL
jgi:hypothetical protein